MALSLSQLVAEAAGPQPAASRAAARLMSVLADAPHRLPEVYQAVASLGLADPDRLPLPRLLLGITGAPGSGKSTLTDALIREYRSRFPERRLGVIAVDPSSPFTGGAVLGDRVRMMRHATDPQVFVRSLASRGHLGGLALGVKGVVRVMALLGCETVLIETVGVGQSEVEVAGVADLVMIVLAPGQGDSVQLLKAGLMETGDLFVVNKADRPDAARLHADLLSMLHVARGDATGHHQEPVSDDELDGLLLTRRPGTLTEPRTYLVSAERQDGVAALVDDLEALTRDHADTWQRHRSDAMADEVREAILEEAQRKVRQALDRLDQGQSTIGAILTGRLSVSAASADVIREAALDPTKP